MQNVIGLIYISHVSGLSLGSGKWCGGSKQPLFKGTSGDGGRGWGGDFFPKKWFVTCWTANDGLIYPTFLFLVGHYVVEMPASNKKTTKRTHQHRF